MIIKIRHVLNNILWTLFSRAAKEFFRVVTKNAHPIFLRNKTSAFWPQKWSWLNCYTLAKEVSKLYFLSMYNNAVVHSFSQHKNFCLQNLNSNECKKSKSMNMIYKDYIHRGFYLKDFCEVFVAEMIRCASGQTSH